jgi:hypothetical protein
MKKTMAVCLIAVLLAGCAPALRLPFVGENKPVEEAKSLLQEEVREPVGIRDKDGMVVAVGTKIEKVYRADAMRGERS